MIGEGLLISFCEQVLMVGFKVLELLGQAAGPLHLDIAS